MIELNTPDRKVLAVEDPIEYQLDGVNQVQIKPQIGLSFAHVLRSMLRHDPDVIMVGEIRDLETAQIAHPGGAHGPPRAVHGAHQHAASTLTRLLDMGVEDYLMTSTLNAIVAQRLVRRLCQDCRGLPATARIARAAWPGGTRRGHVLAPRMPQMQRHRLLRPDQHNEVLVMSDAIRRQILHHAEATELQRAALASACGRCSRTALARQPAGITTIEEVLRVTREVD